MKTSFLRPLAAALVSALGVIGSAQADAIPYANAGFENPVQYSFTAAADGDITAYFYGSTAAFTNVLTMLINGVDTGIVGLNSSSSAFGASLVLGSVHAGDQLVFKMITVFPADIGPWYSEKARNSDGVNHIYSTAFSGGGGVPAGTFVAFEDLPQGGNFDYNDETFVFTNVRSGDGNSVPEPSSLALLGAAGLALSLCRKRQA